MKKAVAILLTLIVLGAGGFFLWRWFSAPYAEGVLPENTVFYLFLPDRKEAQANFQKTLLWKKIQNSPNRQMYDQLGDRMLASIESVTGVSPKPLMDLFTKDLAAGVFSTDPNHMAVVFVAYVSSEADATQFLEQKADPAAKRRIPDLKKGNASYLDTTYYKYNSSQFKHEVVPCYFLADHHLFFTTSEAAVRQVLDVRKKNASSLSKKSIFQNAKSGVSYKRGLFAFVDAQRVLSGLQKNIPEAGRGVWPALMRITGADAIQSVAYNIFVQNDGFQEVGFVSVTDEKAGLVKIYFDQSPKELKSIEMIPADTKTFSAGTLADFGKMWEEVNSQLNKVLTPSQFQKWEQFQTMARGFLNFDIKRDLLDPIGSEFALNYETGPASPAKKRVLLIVDVDQQEQMKATVDRLGALAALRGIHKEQQNFNGMNIDSYPIAFGQYSVAPSVCFNQHWLFFSSSPDLIKAAITAQKDKKNIESSADFQRVTVNFPEKVNSLSYTNVPSFLHTYSGVLTNMNEPWIREFHVEEELNYLAKDLYGSASYTLIKKKGIYFQGYSSIPNWTLSLPVLAAAAPKYITH